MFRRRGVHIPITHTIIRRCIVTAKLPDSRLQTAHRSSTGSFLDVPDTVIRLGCRIMSVPAPAQTPAHLRFSALETVEELQSRLKEMQLQLKELQHKVDTGTGCTSQRRFNFGRILNVASTSAAPLNVLQPAALSTSLQLRLHLSTSLQLRPHPQRRFNWLHLSTSLQLRLHLSTSLQQEALRQRTCTRTYNQLSTTHAISRRLPGQSHGMATSRTPGPD
jgi:hypothetical protein